MPKRTSRSGSELFIVDNSDDDWKALRYIRDWCQLSQSIDIATGYFEIAALLSLQEEWQKVDRIRILMGDEVSKKTKAAFAEGMEKVRTRLDDSLEAEKQTNDFLAGVSAVVEAIRSGKIQCRVYRKAKFHAKAYITHARMEVVGAFGLVGSSNFTYPGLTENIELNVQISGGQVTVLQEWYDEHWNAAEEVTPEILRVIERHTREHAPFEVYARALYELHRREEPTDHEWLIATDVLSEGLNLQDATRLINYDIHWNPVRLMQRIGRVDRRLNPDLEKRLLEDHPEQAPLRGKVAYWNFLPPDELNELLTLYARVTHKTLRISKTFGIEGRKLLAPDDDYEALKDFNHQYEGVPTQAERMQLELQQLLADDPTLEERLAALPGRVFSGKKHPKARTGAVFFCYALPGGEPNATEEGGPTAWYLYDLATGEMLEDPAKIVDAIRCLPATPRHCAATKETLSEVRGKVEKHIRATYMRSVVVPAGVKPVLKAWMELN